MDRDPETIRQLYDRFNARDIEAVFKFLADDVAWANGMDGTHVHGKDAIRQYWTHQWSVIDPHVEPRTIHPREADSYLVEVHQVVKGLEGQVLIDEMVKHAFQMADGLVKRFDIETETQLKGIHPST